MTALEQALHHSATLFARGSRDDDGKLLTHDPRLLSLATMTSGIDVLALIR